MQKIISQSGKYISNFWIGKDQNIVFRLVNIGTFLSSLL